MTSRIDRIAVLGAVLAAVAAATPAPAAPRTEVRTKSGVVAGAVANGVVSWKGIPYAAPPVGELRWRAPQPVAPWTGVRAATEYAHDCMQLPFPSDAAPLGTPPAEDCLYVNVWAPEKPASAKLPVMFWIHGGGFVNGGSSPSVYDGSAFARRGVVLVEPQPPPRPLRVLRPPRPHEGEPERASRELRLPRPDRRAALGAGQRRRLRRRPRQRHDLRRVGRRRLRQHAPRLPARPRALPQGDRGVGRRPRRRHHGSRRDARRGRRPWASPSRRARASPARTRRPSPRCASCPPPTSSGA